MDQLNIFDMLFPKYKITDKFVVIELFGGIGSQIKSLKRLAKEYKKTIATHIYVEWEVNSFRSYKEMFFSDDHNDYSKEYDKEWLIDELFRLGISNDGKKAMKKSEIKRKNEVWIRETYNNIKATNNLVNIFNVHAKDLMIDGIEKKTVILTYSFPCQDISLAGKRLGMKKGSNTKSSTLWEVERILNELSEVSRLPSILLMENVPQVISSANMDDFRQLQLGLESIGFTNYVSLLNAKDYGIPQNRNRCFMISILGQYNYSFPKIFELKLRLKDMLEDEVDEKYYLSEKIMNGFIEHAKKQKEKGNSFSWNIRTEDDIASTLTAHQGFGATDNSIIENVEVFDFRYDDGIRSRVDKGVCPILTCKTESTGISGQPLLKTSKIIGNVNPSGHGMNGNVYRGDIAPTLTTNKGEGLKILTGVIIPEATKKGYAVAYEGDSVNLSYLDSETRRGRVGKEISQTLLCNDNNGVGEKNLRIRKLTPLECWRLMGFDDDDFYKAAKVNSNSQLYKQAGNSIVVDVLYYIFREFFI